MTAQAQDASLLPYSPLMWAEIITRFEAAIDSLGHRALLMVEKGDAAYVADDGPELVATYREWIRASEARSAR